MDAGAFLSMDSLHRPAAHIMGPKACRLVCVCSEGQSRGAGVVVNPSQPVHFLSTLSCTVPVKQWPRVPVHCGISRSTGIKGEVYTLGGPNSVLCDGWTVNLWYSHIKNIITGTWREEMLRIKCGATPLADGLCGKWSKWTQRVTFKGVWLWQGLWSPARARPQRPASQSY